MTWSLDQFDEIYSSVLSNLKLQDDDMIKNINLMDEVISWGVLLRSSKYLTENNFSGKPKKIYREFLSNQLVNFTTIVQEKKEG